MIKESVYECIGNTPLVKLQHLPNATNSTKIYGKIEYINPGLSIKDRAALRLIEDAEKRQLIIKGLLKIKTQKTTKKQPKNTIFIVKYY